MISEVIERTRSHVFESAFSIDSKNVIFTWDFGDGTSPVTTSESNITHVYNEKGTFTINLSADFGNNDVYEHTTAIPPRDELSVYVVSTTIDVLVIPTLSDFLDQDFDINIDLAGTGTSVPLQVSLTDTTKYGDSPPLDANGDPEYQSVESWSINKCPNPLIESVKYDMGDGAIVKTDRARKIFYKTSFGTGTDSSSFPLSFAEPFATITGIGTLKYTTDGTEPNVTNGIEIQSGDNAYIPPTTTEFKLISLNSLNEIQGRAVYQYNPEDVESDKSLSYIFVKEGKYNIKQTLQATYNIEVNGEERFIKIIGEVVKSLEATPFFERWLHKHLDSKFYDSDSKGFQDFAEGTGRLYDRVFNDLHSIIELIDFRTIRNEFIMYLFQTYGDYEEIGRKIGFNAFTENIFDGSRYDRFKDYDIFKRIIDGEATPREKNEFLEYLKNTINRLKEKGTIKSMIDSLNRYQFTADFVELWTDDFEITKENKENLVDIGFQTKNVSKMDI